jgi:ribosomal-protein-alanine N-acetyltransferase
MALDLIPLPLERAIAIAEGDSTLYADMTNADEVSEILGDVAADQADLYEQTGAEAPWIGYLARDSEANALIGICSFKDDPSDGMIEIAYFTFPEFEEQGWGGRMASALIEIAWAEPEMDTIFAHTEQEENASVRILRRLGFTLVGPVEFPEDGPVWEWELRRAAPRE